MSKVGYKQPPEHPRFKKGVSGNPKGRPRGKKTKTAFEVFNAALDRRITVKTADGETRLRLVEAIALSLVQQAAKGDRHARKEVMAFMKLRGDLVAPAPQSQVGVVVVERPAATNAEWMALAEAARLPADPLEGLPGIDREAFRRVPDGRPAILPEVDED